jgi:hypothetical protein
VRLEATARRKLRLMSIPHSTKELIGLVNDIYSMLGQFDDIATAILNEIHSRPYALNATAPL